MSDSEFELFKELIYQQSGIHFTDTNRSILESRLKARLRNKEITSVTRYYDMIVKDQEEMKYLLDSVTTNLTRFFRNTGHFNAFENYVLPELLKHKRALGDKTFRLWSAGCSSGEEPYSLAMSMRQLLPKDFNIEITGSDLSLKSLMTAKSGFYPENRIQDVPDKYLKAYFEKKRDGYQITNEIMRLIKFDYHNLKFDSGLRNMDAVFCRNVIIYFDAEAQKNVINHFWTVMSNFSFLFIGHSESLFGMNTQFQFVKTDWTTFYKKEV